MRKLLSVFILLFSFAIAYGQTISPAGPTTICPRGSRDLTVTAATGTTFQWYKGPRTSLTLLPGETSATYTVTSPGSYWVKVGGTARPDTLGPVVVTLATVPVASFNSSPGTLQCGNTPITFTGPQGAGYTYTWQFQDPNSGANNIITTTSPTAIHKFKGNPGISTEEFQVKLVVANRAGCKDSITHPVTIKQIPGPALSGDGQINFQNQVYFKQCTTEPSEFTFTDKSFPASNVNYEIIWGDGSPGIKSTTSPGTVKHTYNVGNYPLRFIATGTNGCIDTTHYGVFVGDAPNGGIGTENPILTGCTGTAFNFPFLSSVFTNSEGTYYDVSVDDGSPATVYSQPPPPSYVHTFNKPSCGNGTSNSNFFTVSLTIKNPCNVSGIPGTIGGIKISSTPIAGVVFSKDTACINEPVTMTDRSINNYINESGECAPGKSLWYVTPGAQGTDWEIISGAPGSDNGNLFPSDWTAGATSLQVRFLKPGIYSIKVKTGGSNQCGLDSIVKTLCVNPLPKADFAMAADTICSSLVDSVIYSPATEYCGKNTFEWNVTYSPLDGCFPATQNYTYVDGTSAASAKPHFNFASPGIYTIRLIAYSPGRSCSDIAEKRVVVKSVPSVSLPANGEVCQNQPVRFANTATCFVNDATYQWLFPGSDVPTSNAASPPPVTYPAVGKYDITLNVTNECGTTNAIEHLVVGTIGTASAGPDTTVCGTSVTMAANEPVTGATGVWTTISGPNVPSITNAASPTTTITNIVAGTYRFQWKIFNSGCADSSIVSITIVPGPSIANAGPDQLLCLDTVTTLAANMPVRGNGKWALISGPNSPLVANADSPVSRVSGLKPGIYIFRWTISFSNCDPSIDTLQIKINDNPTTAKAGPDQVLCSSSSVLTGNAPTTGTGEWLLLSGPNVPVIAAPEAATTTVSGMISGTYFFVWKISNGPCPASLDTVQVVVSTLANNVIGEDQSVCVNTVPAIITGNIPSGGNGNYIYQWQQSLDSGIVWTNIDTAKSADYHPGVMTVSACFRRIVKTTLCPAGDTSNSVCITVTPDAKAVFSASKTALCAPANVDSFITVTPFADRNRQYNWYQNNTLISSTVMGEAPSFVIAAPGADVLISLVTTSLYGCKPDSMSILFKTIPSVTAGFTMDAASGCGPLTVNFTNTSTLLDSSIRFFWDFGNGTNLSTLVQPGPIVFEPAASFTDTTYYITLKAFSGCDTSVVRDSISVFAKPKARFVSTASGCSPFRDTIVNNSFGMDAFTRYYWDFGDNTSTTTTTTGPVYHTYNTGIVDTFAIRLIAENRCGRDSQQMNVVVSPNMIRPRFSVNGNEIYGCAPHTITFQNSTLGASALLFDFGDGTLPLTVANTEAEIKHTYMAAGEYTVNIKLQNSCTDTTVIRKVSVYPSPLSSFDVSKKNVCDGEAISINNTSVEANSYQWLWGDSTNSSGFDPSHVYSSPGTYSIRLVAARINSSGTVCTDTSSSIPVTVVARIPAAITINSGTACVPYTLQVSAEGADNAGNVEWYFYDRHVAPGIFYATGKDASYTYANDGTDSIKVVVTNTAGCADSTVKLFTVHNTPTLDFPTLNVKTCNPDTSITFSINPVYTGNDPISYEWYVNGSLSGNSNPFIYRFTGTAGVTATNPYSVKVLLENSFGCGDSSVAANVTIQTLAPPYIAVSPSAVQQQPNYTFSFRDTGQTFSNATYLWSTGDRSGQQLPGREITYTYGDTGTYRVHLLVQDPATGCSEDDSINVFVLGVPGFLYVPNAFCPGCQKAELRQFLPLGKGLKEYHLVIFNIWGQKVFETTSLDANGVPNQPWNGNWVSGKNTQQGAFSWYIEARYINGSEWKGMLNPKTNKLEKKGFVSIIR